jgi:hypothetical protein
MIVSINDIVPFDVTTHHPSTGAVTDADAAPTFSVFEEATDTPILANQAMTKRTSLDGNYRGSISVTAANGFEADKWYSVIVTGIVNSITAKHVALHFMVGGVDVAKINGTQLTGNGSTTPWGPA